MKTCAPIDLITQLVTAMNEQDLETALTLFEPGASFVMRPGVVVSGTAGIRQALEGFMALKPTLTIEAQQIVQAGDVAQYCARWSIQESIQRELLCNSVADPPASCGVSPMGGGFSWWITRGDGHCRIAHPKCVVKQISQTERSRYEDHLLLHRCGGFGC